MKKMPKIRGDEVLLSLMLSRNGRQIWLKFARGISFDRASFSPAWRHFADAETTNDADMATQNVDNFFGRERSVQYSSAPQLVYTPWLCPDMRWQIV
jgi:hypothetical protein